MLKEEKDWSMGNSATWVKGIEASDSVWRRNAKREERAVLAILDGSRATAEKH
jgi:hypothetical protein